MIRGRKKRVDKKENTKQRERYQGGGGGGGRGVGGHSYEEDEVDE